MPQNRVFDRLLALDDLREGVGFEIPSQEEYETNWAAQPHTYGSTKALGLPFAWRRNFFISPSGLRTLGVWVDSEEGWLWAAVPTTVTDWYTPEQTRTLMWPLGPEVIPQWVQEATPNRRDPVNPIGRANTLLVRRKLQAGQAQALLEELLPPLEQYPVPAAHAQVLRAGGWTPDDLTALWWTVETDADAAALAAHPPIWWQVRDWPLGAVLIPEPARESPLPAGALADLAAAGVGGGVFAACLDLGITDPERIKAVRAPQIPDDATRVLLTDPDGSTAIALDAATARKTLKDSPRYLLGQVTAHTGLLPLASVDPAQNWKSVTVWEDGLLVKGLLMPPAHTSTQGLRKPWAPRNHLTPDEETIQQASREWHASLPRRYEATEPLLRTVADAVNFPELCREVWSGWADSASTDSELVEPRSTIRALAADTISRRELTLTRHTVHAAEDHHLWVVTDALRIDGEPAVRSSKHWAYGHQGQARDRLEELTDQFPPMVTVEEAAALMDTTREALAQAIARAKRDRTVRNGRPPLPLPLRLDRTDWYNPRELRAWWIGRPGRGRRS